MGLKFGTLEWGLKLKELVNSKKEFKKLGKDLTTTFSLGMAACPEKGFPQGQAFFIKVKKGQVQDIELVSEKDPAGKKAEYVLNGPYENWVAVSNGALDPIEAITDKKFQVVSGDMRRLVKYIKHVNLMIATMKEIDTQF